VAALNCFATGLPRSTNHQDIVGSFDFGVRSEYAPNWHNANCIPKLPRRTVVTDNPSSPTSLSDCWNRKQPQDAGD
jgi:phosphatidylinositol-3-phosphatase